MRCKTQKFIDETKKFQKQGLQEGEQQFDKTKKQLNKVKDNAIKKIPKIN